MGLSVVAKIGIGWAFAVGGGLYAFILSKRSIDAKRYETMKARERVRNSNYE